MNTPSRTAACLTLALAALVPGCDLFTGPDRDGRPARIEALPRALSVAEREIIARSNRFAFDLLREVHARATEPNVFLSPLSASMALGMTLNGAAGVTFDSMRATLGFEGLSQEEINASYRSLTELLLGLDRKVEVAIANATFANRGVIFEPSFFQAVETWFDAEAQTLDFSDPGSLDVINGWAAEHTHDRITEVLDELDPAVIMFLLNAVYFKGDWTNRFAEADTRPGEFRLADGRTVQVQRMHGRIPAALAWRPDVLVGELAYGGQAFVLTVVLPQGERTLADMIATLDAETWQDWTAPLDQVDYRDADEIQVALPKFELEYERKLNDALIALGMGIAFSPAADFTRLTPGGAYIDFVKQNTFLKVDEKGTEAAAVTVVAMRDSAPPQLIVDRPYLMAIRERLSGTILFLGAIGDPR